MSPLPADVPTPVPTDLPAAVEQAAAQALAAEPDEHRTLVLARLRRAWPDLLAGLTEAYGDAGHEVAVRAAALAVRAAVERPQELRLLDLQRLVEPDWFQSPRMLGYAAYADRFAGTLAGVGERVGHLADLGVTYLHLLPLLTPRPGPDDGGYAVADHRSVRADLGTVDDLRDLTAVLRGHGISLALDLVLNHVAAEHPWAQAARAGDPRYRAYFHVFADRTEPDAFERTLPEVFPDLAPGSFSWDAGLGAWVWTTFNSWQWDLNWHNPEVLLELADVVCFLAEPGRRGAAPGRHRVPVEAARHRLPEPAGGARAHPGAARGRPRRGSGGGVQGGGDRRAGPAAGLPRHRPAHRQGQRPGVPQQPHGAGLVDARRQGHDAAAHGAGALRRAAPRHVVGDLPALPRRHRLGGRRRRRRGRRAVRAAAPRLPVRLVLRRLPGQRRPRAGLPGERGHRRPADQRERRLAARAGGGGRRPGAHPDGAGPRGARPPRGARLGRPAGAVVRGRARPAQRHRLGGRARARRRQPLGPPPPPALGPRPPDPRAGHPGAPGVVGPAARRPGAGRPARPARERRDRGARPGRPAAAGDRPPFRRAGAGRPVRGRRGVAQRAARPPAARRTGRGRAVRPARRGRRRRARALRGRAGWCRRDRPSGQPGRPR